ncbi:transaldolase family protein [Pseudomonas abietaniphila]|uniref:transaldolase family protein n=1 Tax=Pseudomonas abietaniphila TaxID=89065 RepID=UPI003217B2FB
MFNLIESWLPDNFSASQSGLSGATTNPRLVARAVLEDPRPWQDFTDSLPPQMAESEKARQLYDQVIVQGAGQFRALWNATQQRQGWLSAQIEGGERMHERMLVTRGLQLASLAPNVMIKVPGSEQGYRAIEQLVAQGCSINNTFCFTVSQFAACLKAIHSGRLRARVTGVNTDRARYVITFMIGRLGAEHEFERQAAQRRLCLTAADRRWAELAVYQAIQALLRRWQTPARLLLCSLKVDTDVRGREHCWHLQRTGADTTLYTLTPDILEFLIRRQQRNQPVTPATEWVQVPRRVLSRLMAIPYFNQAYFEGEQAPSRFAQHPAFITASHDAREGQERLLAFVKGASNGALFPAMRPLSDLATGDLAMGRVS